MTDTLLKNSFSEYTEAEFVALLEELAKEDEEAENDDRADLLLLHFEKISEHPAGSDLIYYPEPGADNSPEGITQIVKNWRFSQGLPGFKGA
ncbi:bacteriocin immunity protein [Pseudomonas capsici]|uniref:Bacteriocin immunity protein n=1 Tax=Pseudomonas capsici TaxID=2810614 RepID=A0ABT3BX43_9PSED|nr:MULTISPECIES: bacteriocin immunity protein [Pseudomonas]MBN6714096.1 bacteriocin immunity protein [Pseudomonas capsici]MBN6719348.1 bacteriocin immunity protein [Pseudomonas capsici]MBN6722838.1 bacteriocin immunity protein [Pseudomonas capsici]MCV4262860.1 bacteriocin immunity protein [Pseudomonas capsici]MCV4267752.1 bacteriocin immunity protein [Pseudomonas capsici]